MENINNVETPIINETPIKKSRYTEAQKRAIKKYRENNREKYNTANRLYVMNYYNKNKDNEDFKEKNRQKAKKYNEKIKMKNI